MNAFFALILALSLLSACKHQGTHDQESTSSNKEVSPEASATLDQSDSEGLNLTAAESQTESLIKERLPHMSPQNTLTVYDACKDTWIDTGLPFRAEPSFPDRKASDSLRKPVIPYRVGRKIVRLHEVDIYNLEKHVLLGKENVPKSFRGLWWMDGNPAPEVVLSLAHVVYDKSKGTLTSLYNEQDSYLMQPSTAGIALWNAFRLAKVKLHVRIPPAVDMEKPQFGDQLFVDIALLSKLVVKARLMPTTYISDQHWKRETGDHCYNLRQIVDENGKKLPVYDRFVKNVMQQTKDGKGTNPEVLVMPKNIP